MAMGSIAPTQITKPEEPKKKDAAFAFDVFGKGVKQTEVVDNSNASMGFDDLFGGMKSGKDNQTQQATGAQANGGSF